MSKGLNHISTRTMMLYSPNLLGKRTQGGGLLAAAHGRGRKDHPAKWSNMYIVSQHGSALLRVLAYGGVC